MMNAKELLRQTESLLLQNDHITLAEASATQLHNALSTAAMNALTPTWVKCEAKRQAHRQAYYLSAEYLVGRMVYNNLFCLGLLDDVKALLAEKGVDIAILEDIEDDAFGNGGLGRLAACFLDSAVTTNVPLTGYGLRYRYGLFKQTFVNGYQHEEPDDWSRFGDPWSIRRVDQAVVVKMKTGDVLAVPYDMPLVGYDTSTVNSLRLWSARAPKRIDLSDFNHGHYVQASEEKELAEAISNILYPEDNHYEGKLLRLKQQYFFTSATLQYILKDFKKLNGTNWSKLPEKVVIHINDTHPGLAIPELMRLLMDEEGLGWDEAQQIVSRTMAYTNHTIMAEALEKWPEDMVKSLLPRIYQILVEMNKRLCARLWNFFPGEAERVGRMAIIAYGYIHMANLCVAMTFSTNGVSKLHGDILKQETFHDFYLVMPEKFSAITNGITHRRWLLYSNPQLTALLKKAIGDGFVGLGERSGTAA